MTENGKNESERPGPTPTEDEQHPIDPHILTVVDIALAHLPLTLRVLRDLLAAAKANDPCDDWHCHELHSSEEAPCDDKKAYLAAIAAAETLLRDYVARERDAEYWRAHGGRPEPISQREWVEQMESRPVPEDCQDD